MSKKYTRTKNPQGGLRSDRDYRVDKDYSENEVQIRMPLIRAKIIKARSNTSYDIQLYTSQEIVERVGTINYPEKPFTPGREVAVAYIAGWHNQVAIFGTLQYPVSGGGSEGKDATNYSTKQEQIDMATYAVQHAKFVMQTDNTEIFGTSGGVSKYLPGAVAHANITEDDELHITKGHDHSDVNNGGVISSLMLQTGLKLTVLGALPVDDSQINMCIYNNAGTEELYVYLNSSWVKIA